MGAAHRCGRPPAQRRSPMTTKVGTLVDRYLEDLEAALGDLPPNRRREILDEVGEHIGAARAALDTETEAGVRTVLERLGDPAADHHRRIGTAVGGTALNLSHWRFVKQGRAWRGVSRAGASC